MRHVASKVPSPVVEEGADAAQSEEAALEQLYEQIAWPLSRTYGHAYDAFKLILTYVEFTPASAYDRCNGVTEMQKQCWLLWPRNQAKTSHKSCLRRSHAV